MTASIHEYTKAFESGWLDRPLALWYGPEWVEIQKKRYLKLLATMQARFDPGPVVILSTPGRTELGGNHTDHNRGRVLTAAVHLDLVAVVSPVDDFRINVRSDGFPDVIEVDLSALEPREDEKGAPEGLIRGVAAGFAEAGLRVGGFDACVHSTVPLGTGLSSSAAFEVLIGKAFSQLYNNGTVGDVFLAEIGRAAEARFFGKPCGLMDQIACAVGGILHIDFINPLRPEIERIDTVFGRFGYQLVVVNTGGSHADLTGDYAAVPREMRAVAAEFGRDAVRGLSLQELLNNVPELRKKAGDRAILRVMHFIEENKRVKEMVASLRENRFADYLRLVSESGDSSWRFLQNCSSTSDTSNQGIPLALAMTDCFPGGQSACRVHGGGFAGTIQAYVPDNRLEGYILYMERVFGPKAVIPLRLRATGCSVLSLGE